MPRHGACSARRCRTRRATRGGSALEAQQRADPADGLEIAAMRRGEDAATVCERLVDREVEPLRVMVELGAVERTLATLELKPSAGRAAPGVVLGALLVEEQLDAPIRRRLERGCPAGGRATGSPRLLAPALECLGLSLRALTLEQLGRRPEQVGPTGMRPRR